MNLLLKVPEANYIYIYIYNSLIIQIKLFGQNDDTDDCVAKKNLPNLSPEWKEAQRKRLIENRSNPYTGESAHLFTKDGIKSE
jgi:hypothetical protein